ncbi:PadR family transcriptional regulator [Streptomyces sp. NPDC005562]|uniref:PadR family transcriptional regulator n=1 Tax=unclassified Streptomyces TaxID=2593676 RepID=UPI0033A5460E
MAEPSAVWTRAVLPLCLLGILESEPRSYGYALLSRLGEAGLHGVKAATLYPALTRLEEEGAVEVEWGAGEGGPGRKYYRITAEGRARLRRDQAAWGDFSRTVDSLLPATATKDEGG